MGSRLPSFVIALVISACAGGPITPVATPADGGTALVAWQEPATLDLLYAPGVQSAATIARVAVEGLLRVGPDGAEIPALAREVPTLVEPPATGCVPQGPAGASHAARDRRR